MKKSQDIDALIEEAIIDAYGEDEQRVGFLVMFEENIPVPFSATIAGLSIRVTKFDVDDHRIFVRCMRDGKTQKWGQPPFPPLPPDPITSKKNARECPDRSFFVSL